MFAIANILQGIAQVFSMFLTIYIYIVIGRVIISWVNADPYNPIVRFLHRATEPAFIRARRWLPWLSNISGIDLTPIVVLAFIYLLQFAVVQNLYELAEQLK